MRSELAAEMVRIKSSYGSGIAGVFQFHLIPMLLHVLP